MDIRYSANQRDVKRYTTQELRDEFLITGLYQPDKVSVVYSHVDRMVTFGIMPVTKNIALEEGIDIWANFGTSYILERREIGFFNLGGSGSCTVDGVKYQLNNKDCIYITKGAEKVTFNSCNPDDPAKYYGVSAPAHCSYETKLLTMADAAKNPVGAAETSNKRVINQFIHPDVLPTCQLMMGMTILEQGSVWNTMPLHTHERRMEIYTYFDLDAENVVFHLMGEPGETRHLVIKNEDAVISPSWSVHAGCGTSNYSFIWAMGGENQAFTDMDTIRTAEIK